MIGFPDEITIGVVIVAYGSADVLPSCLRSLARSTHMELKTVVVDNASPDGSAEAARRAAADFERQGRFGFREIAAEALDGPSMDGLAADGLAAHGLAAHALPSLTLVTSSVNRGFAGGANIGLDLLRRDPEVDLFWLLNPDTEVPPDTAAHYALKAAAGPVGLMGGRVLFHGAPDMIQSDGGRTGRWTGICRNVNYGEDPATAVPAAPDTLDYLMGANLVASRPFLAQVGLLREDYFLYYEEVDWAFRRGDHPLAFLPDAIVHHHGGTAAGTGNKTRRATPLSTYYNFRNRMRFTARFNPKALPIAYAVSLWLAFRLLRAGAREEGMAALRGVNQLAFRGTGPERI